MYHAVSLGSNGVRNADPCCRVDAVGGLDGIGEVGVGLKVKVGRGVEFPTVDVQSAQGIFRTGAGQVFFLIGLSVAIRVVVGIDG